MIPRKLVQGVPCVPYDRKPHQDWKKGGTRKGVLKNVPSLSCLVPIPGQGGHLEEDGTFQGLKGCPLSNVRQHWFFARTGHMGHTGHRFIETRGKGGRP